MGQNGEGLAGVMDRDRNDPGRLRRAGVLDRMDIAPSYNGTRGSFTTASAVARMPHPVSYFLAQKSLS